MIRISIANRQKALDVDRKRIREAVQAALDGRRAPACDARISVAVVGDRTIARLNQQYLAHEGPTDVLSFLLEDGPQGLEGEVIVGAETALRQAGRYGWRPQDELLLYVVHGTLHLLGCRDDTPAQRTAMRRRERACLARLGIEARYRYNAAARNGTRKSGKSPREGS